MIRGNNLIEDVECVTCPYCTQQFQSIHWRHLKTHSKTIQDIRLEYPNLPTMTRKYYEEVFIVNQKKAIEAKKKKDKDTKPVNCFYCQKEIKVNINASINYSVCKECKRFNKSPLYTDEVKSKTAKTMIERYGVTNASYRRDVIVKRLKTRQKNKDEVEGYVGKQGDRWRKTMKERLGENWKGEMYKLLREGMVKKYGAKYALQMDGSKDRYRQTSIDRFGVDNPFKNEEVRDKYKLSILYKSNGLYDNPMKNRDTCQRAINNRNVDKWKGSIQSSHLKRFEPKFRQYLEHLDLKFVDDEYQGAYYRHTFRCKRCSEEFKQPWNNIQQGYRCPICYSRNISNTSKAQEEITRWIEDELNLKVSMNNRTILHPYELDIVILDKKVAIEYCGLYWHKDSMITNTRPYIHANDYHTFKLHECLKNGYRLITIFEDEWIFKKEIVKNIIKNILNKNNNLAKLDGRKCVVKEIDAKTKGIFLNQYHIQGNDHSIVKLGLFYNDTITSIMTFSHSNLAKGQKESRSDIWELSRFCNDYKFIIRGGASKLLSYFKNNYDWNQIYSYCDLRWSNGDLYNKLGFTLDKITRPNYWYVNCNKLKRIHRFALRKRSNEPRGISEWILRYNEGYDRIWDCGNLKFITIVDKDHE